MITTVTLNTSVDKLYLVEKLEDYTVMRVKKVSNTAGGKGLNVSKVAYLLGEKVSALGFAGGFNGSYVSSLLEAQGIRLRSDDALYSGKPPVEEEVSLTAVPYYTWGNRGAGGMRVWIHE